MTIAHTRCSPERKQPINARTLAAPMASWDRTLPTAQCRAGIAGRRGTSEA
jgi:hypothetical protein